MKNGEITREVRRMYRSENSGPIFDFGKVLAWLFVILLLGYRIWHIISHHT